MKKYCGKCGAKLNKKGLCPNCDKQAISKSKQKLKKVQYSIFNNFFSTRNIIYGNH